MGIITIYFITFLLLSNASTLRRDVSLLFSRCLLILLFCSFIIGLLGIKLISLKKGIGLFGGLLHITAISNIFHIFIYFICFIILHLTSFYARKLWIEEFSNLYYLKNIIYNTRFINKTNEQYIIMEYPLILLFTIIGATFLISSSDIVSIFLSIELQSYGLYLLSTLYRNSELSTSAALTYFLLGGLSSCFILLGTSLLYVNSGTTNLDGFYVVTNLSKLNYSTQYLIQWYSANYINFSLLIMSVGFLFKISAAPFHFWSPDVYDAIPTIVTTFVAIVAKISIFIFLFEVVYYTNNYHYTLNFNWTISLLFSSILSLIIGTILGLSQSRIKRLFAYSTISHLGFILLGLSINSLESIQSFVFYLMQYTMSNLNAFFILITMGYILFIYINNTEQYKKLLEKNNSPIQLTDQIKGFIFLNPLISVSLLLTIYSFIGIPPLIGFFGKQMILSAALDNGYMFISLIAILTSVISAVYYLNIIKLIFFDKSEYQINPELDNKNLKAIIFKNNINNTITYNPKNMIISSNLSLTITILTLIILLFIFNPQEWLSMANILAILIFNP